MVALLWQIFFARCFGVRVDAVCAALLVLSVWLIYSADRTLDAWRGQRRTARHRFYSRHWPGLIPIWGIAFGSAAWLAVTQLETKFLVPGSFTLAAVAGYFGLVHCGLLEGGKGRCLKEALVGILFASGASLLVWGRLKTWADAATIFLFSGLCWMNCVVIQKWEEDRLDWSPDGWAILLAAAAGVPLYAHRPLLGGAEMASACAFVLLNQARPRLSADVLRVLADVALLSPVLFLPAVAGRG